MADEQTTSAEGSGAPPPAPTPTPPAERVFTQEEVNAIVGQRLAEERRKKAPTPEVKQGDAPKGADPEPDQLSKLFEQVGALSAQLQKSEADRAFAEKVGGIQLSKEQRDLLRGLPSEQVDAAIKAFGLGAPAKAPTAEAPTYRSPGAVVGAPDEVMQADATKWTSDYISQLQSEGRLLDEVEKWRRGIPGGGQGLFRRRIPKAS